MDSLSHYRTMARVGRTLNAQESNRFILAKSVHHEFVEIEAVESILLVASHKLIAQHISNALANSLRLVMRPLRFASRVSWSEFTHVQIADSVIMESGLQS